MQKHGYTSKYSPETPLPVAYCPQKGLSTLGAALAGQATQLFLYYNTNQKEGYSLMNHSASHPSNGELHKTNTLYAYNQDHGIYEAPHRDDGQQEKDDPLKENH